MTNSKKQIPAKKAPVKKSVATPPQAQSSTQTPRQKQKRNHLRFPADVGSQASILQFGLSAELSNPFVGLVVDESMGGCSVVFIKSPLFEEGNEILIKVGHMDPMRAQIKWIKILEKRISYIGIQFLEE